MALGFSTNMEAELFRAELVNMSARTRWRGSSPSTRAGTPSSPSRARRGRAGGLELAAQIAEVREAVGLSLERAGSNNWVVSGERSTTGSRC